MHEFGFHKAPRYGGRRGRYPDECATSWLAFIRRVQPVGATGTVRALGSPLRSDERRSSRFGVSAPGCVAAPRTVEMIRHRTLGPDTEVNRVDTRDR
jgi:hypothetical protein